MPALSIFSVPDTLSPDDRKARRHMLARTGLAWLAMMQVMMFAFPGYVSVEHERGPELVQAIHLMNWASLVLTVPIILYCAAPVWAGALAQLRRGRIGIDVPVALGIVGAFLPSVIATWTGKGEVYFDSVTMFVAFLLSARYLEFCARQSLQTGYCHKWIEDLRTGATRRANEIAFWFVIAQLSLAVAAGGFWWFYHPEHAVPVMVALLVMSCPCALSMAVPAVVAAAHARLLNRPCGSIDELLWLLRATGRAARQNLWGSLAWHLLMAPLAVMGLVAPWLAAVTMLVSSLAVAGNAWLLYRRAAQGLPDATLPLNAALEPLLPTQSPLSNPGD